MNITVHPGPRRLRPSAGVTVDLTFTLVDPTKNQPYANTAVQIRLGSISWDEKTDQDGVLTVAFYQIGSKDKMHDALSVQLGSYPPQPISYAFYPNALITQTVPVPALAVVASTLQPEILDACFVAENGSRTVSLYTPGVSGTLSITRVRGESGLLVHKNLPARVETKDHPKLTFRGSQFGELLGLRLEHAESRTSFPLEVHVVRDADKDPEERRQLLLKASSHKREDPTALKAFKAATKEANKTAHAADDNEDNWTTDPAISLNTFIQRHRATRIFLIGESHKNPEDLESVWSILDALHDPPNHLVRLLFEQIPFYDLRQSVGEKAGVVDFQTGMKALTAGTITPELFNRWCNWSAYWTNPEEDDKILTLLKRAVHAGMIVSGLDLQKDGALKTGDVDRDPFMKDRLLELLKDTIQKNTNEVLVTINGRAHLLGKGGVKLLGIGRLIRATPQPPTVVTLRPVQGGSPVTFIKRQGTDDYQFTVANYQG